MEKAKFTVYGEPKGKGRPRFNTKTGHAITPKDTVSYENLVKLEWQTAYGTESFPKEAMQEKECQEGTLTLKLDVSLAREYVPNYNPNIPGESREIAKPKFSHKVTSQMKVEDMKKGNLDTEMELFLNEETGEYEMRPVADTTQRSIFDADYRDVTEPGPAGIEPDNGPEYIEHPELPGEVADEHALPGPVEEYEDADESVYDDSTGDNPEDTQFTDETDLDGAGDGTEITSGTEEDKTDTEDDEYGYDEPEEEE